MFSRSSLATAFLTDAALKACAALRNAPEYLSFPLRSAMVRRTRVCCAVSCLSANVKWSFSRAKWFYYSVSSDLGSRRNGTMPMKVTPLRSVQGFSYGSPVTTTFLKLSPM